MEFNWKELDIYLVQSGDEFLVEITKNTPKKAEKSLVVLNVRVIKNKRITPIEADQVFLFGR